MKKLVAVYVLLATTGVGAGVVVGEGRFPVKDCVVVYEQGFEKAKDNAWGRDAANDLADILSKVTAPAEEGVISQVDNGHQLYLSVAVNHICCKRPSHSTGPGMV